MKNFKTLMPRVAVSKAAPFCLPSALLAFSLTACGGTADPEATNEDDNSSESGNTAEEEPEEVMDVGRILDGSESCTEEGTICMSMVVPETMMEPPGVLQFVIYDSPDIPNHPPNGFAGVFTAPDLTAGETIYVELTDDGMRGDYWMFVVLYMRPDAFGAPIGGLDYHQLSDPPALPLDGSPLTIDDPVLLTL